MVGHEDDEIEGAPRYQISMFLLIIYPLSCPSFNSVSIYCPEAGYMRMFFKSGEIDFLGPLYAIFLLIAGKKI